jgi:hypothetical protein
LVERGLRKRLMREFKITRNNVIDVFEIFVNLSDRVSSIRQIPSGKGPPIYEVKFEYHLPERFISEGAGLCRYTTFTGCGEEISAAVQDIVNQIQEFFGDHRRKDELIDYQIEFEMKIASALGLLKRVSS